MDAAAAKQLSDSQSAEVAQSAAVHAEAVEKARAAQMESAFENAMEKFFNRGLGNERFIDISRIPFICDDIRGIHKEVKAMRENSVTKEDIKDLKLTRNIVFATIGIICVAFIGALVTNVYHTDQNGNAASAIMSL